MKVIFSSVLSLVLLFLVASNLYASGFYLKSIGSLDVQGSAYPHYWYTGENVTLTGVATAGDQVTVEIDGTTANVTSDTSGTWTYSTTLAQGDHAVVLSTASSNPYTFTLTIGETPESVGSIQAPETPAAGVGSITVLMLALGVVGIGIIAAPVILSREGNLQ